MIAGLRHDDNDGLQEKDRGLGVAEGIDLRRAELDSAGAPIVAMSLPLAGRVPEGEWARRICYVRMISMSPRRKGSSRYVHDGALFDRPRGMRTFRPCA